jgi:hypothetical protein
MHTEIKKFRICSLIGELHKTCINVQNNVSVSCADMFEVYMMKSSALNASGECILQVTQDSINLLDIENPQRIQLSWPLSSIRRYSVERGIFIIESGR